MPTKFVDSVNSGIFRITVPSDGQIKELSTPNLYTMFRNNTKTGLVRMSSSGEKVIVHNKDDTVLCMIEMCPKVKKISEKQKNKSKEE